MARLTPDAPFPPGCAARYRPVKLIASGGFGQVWLAEQLGLERRVAVKLLLDDVLEQKEQVERFLEEARITAAIQHPGVVTLLDHGVDEGVPWIALEYLPGRNLRQILEAGPVEPELARAAASQVAEALEAAHAKGVLHRDVKPENVIELEPGRFKVTDFGIAKWRREGAVKTRTGVILGTPAYLAPEVIRGEPVTARADVYALGVMSYELFSGRLPFEDANPMVLLERHLKTAPPPLTGVAPGVARAVMQALEKEPSERTPSALAFRDALSGLEVARAAVPPAGARSRGTSSTREPERPKQMCEVTPPPPARRHALGIVLAVAALALGALAVKRAPDPPVATVTPSTAAVSPPAAPEPTGPLGMQMDVAASENEILVNAMTVEPALLELKVSGDPRTFRDAQPTRLHLWRVDCLEPSTALTARVIDPSGRRTPAYPDIQARTRAKGFRRSALQMARIIDRVVDSMLLGTTDLDVTALEPMMERLRDVGKSVSVATWRRLLSKVGRLHDPRAYPILLEMSKMAPPEVSFDHRWGAIAKLRARQAFPDLFEQLKAAPDVVKPLEAEALADALFNSDPDAAHALVEAWSARLPGANEFQLFTLVSLMRDLHLPGGHPSFAKLVAAARTGWLLEHAGRMASQVGGPGAMEAVLAAARRLEAMGDAPRLAALLMWSSEIASAGDGRAFVTYLDGAPIVVAAAVRCLATIGDRTRLPRMRELVRAQEPTVRSAAVWAVGELRDADAVKDLASMLGRPGTLPTSGGLVPRALGQIGNQDAIQALRAYALSSRATGVATGDPAYSAEAVEVGDTLRELGRLKAVDMGTLLNVGLRSRRPYIAGRSLEAVGLLGDPAAIPLLKQTKFAPELEPLEEAVLAWLAGKPPQGEPVTVDPATYRRSRVSVAVGQRFSIYTVGLFLDENHTLSVLCGTDVRRNKVGTWVVPRVGVEVLRDGRTSLDRCTTMGAGEIVLYLLAERAVAGFATVRVKTESPGR